MNSRLLHAIKQQWPQAAQQASAQPSPNVFHSRSKTGKIIRGISGEQSAVSWLVFEKLAPSKNSFVHGDSVSLPGERAGDVGGGGDF